MSNDDTGDFKAQFGVFWRSAVSGIGDLKDAVVSTAKVGKLKLDATMLRRHREKLIADLGQATLEAIRSGEWSPPEAVRSLVDKIGAVDDQLVADQDQVDDLLYKKELAEDDFSSTVAADVVDAKSADGPETTAPKASAPEPEVVEAKEAAETKPRKSRRKKKTES